MQAKLKTCYGCGEQKRIWKNDSGNKYCQQCWNRVKFEDNPPKPKDRKAIAKKSAKMKAKDAIYSKLRVIYLNAHPMCEIAKPGCTGQATDVHHKSYRGANHNNLKTWMSACRHCHDWVHANPKESRKLGFLD
jgi:hypothetical protein